MCSNQITGIAEADAYAGWIEKDIVNIIYE